MARYLLVEVDDNATADRMRAQLDNAGEAKGIRVIGMFTKATQLCGCPSTSGKSVRGARFGWWLCEQCRRPKRGSAQTLRNILDDEGTPSKYLELMICVRWVLDKATGKVRTARSLCKDEWR